MTRLDDIKEEDIDLQPIKNTPPPPPSTPEEDDKQIRFVYCSEAYEEFKKETKSLEGFIKYMNSRFQMFRVSYVDSVELKDGSRIEKLWLIDKVPVETESKKEKEKIIV